MSISLTWASYALMVSICLGVYYTIVGFLLYRTGKNFPAANADIKATVAVREAESLSDNLRSRNLFGDEVKSELHVEEDETGIYPEAQDFADEIVAYTSSCDENTTKEELIHSIQRIIQKYPSLKDSDHKYELNQLIAISTENYCSIHVSAEELSELWRD